MFSSSTAAGSMGWPSLLNGTVKASSWDLLSSDPSEAPVKESPPPADDDEDSDSVAAVVRLSPLSEVTDPLLLVSSPMSVSPLSTGTRGTGSTNWIGVTGVLGLNLAVCGDSTASTPTSEASTLALATAGASALSVTTAEGRALLRLTGAAALFSSSLPPAAPGAASSSALLMSRANFNRVFAAESHVISLAATRRSNSARLSSIRFRIMADLDTSIAADSSTDALNLSLVPTSVTWTGPSSSVSMDAIPASESWVGRRVSDKWLRLGHI
ncbi:MAG: hypothetical protein JKY23_06005 [Nitrospinaceae bacterium]|nr:hypothetical protein [Nitrospinaceae bacterium]